MSIYQDIIKVLVSSEYYKLNSQIDKLINDKDFIKYIVFVKNPIVFDRFIKMCEYKMDTSVLQEQRNEFIKKSILSLNNDNIYEFFELNNPPTAIDERIANRYLTEYIVSYYLGDNYYNFLTNFNQMVSYLKRTKKELISNFSIQLYEEFIDLLIMSTEDKIAFFRLLLDDNIMERFYDDLNTVREDSHKELVDSTLKLTKDSAIYQKDLSRRFEVDVYYLDGEEFYGFTRSLSLRRDDTSDTSDYVLSRKERLGYSFSYISNNNIGTSDYDGNNVILYYDDINYKNIMYVHHSDLHAKKMKTQQEYLSVKENEIVTPNSLISNTTNYNEVFIKSDQNGIKPSGLICYDNVSVSDINFARRYEIAILLINTKKYKRHMEYDEDYELNTYNI